MERTKESKSNKEMSSELCSRERIHNGADTWLARPLPLPHPHSYHFRIFPHFDLSTFWFLTLHCCLCFFLRFHLFFCSPVTYSLVFNFTFRFVLLSFVIISLPSLFFSKIYNFLLFNIFLSIFVLYYFLFLFLLLLIFPSPLYSSSFLQFCDITFF